MRIILLLTDLKNTEALIKWAVGLGEHYELPASIFCTLPPGKYNEVTKKKFLAQTRKIANKIGEIELNDAFDCSSYKEILEKIEYFDPLMVMMGIDGKSSPDTWTSKLASFLMKKADCDIFMLDISSSEQMNMKAKRILVPMDVSLSKYALRDSVARRDEGATIVPLLVSAEFSGDSKELANRELLIRIKESGVDPEEEFIEPTIVLADSQTEGVLSASHECDLLLIGSRNLRLLRDLRKKSASQATRQAAKNIPIAVYFPKEARGKTISVKLRNRLKASIPELSLADRISLFDRIQVGSRWRPDFAIMIGLSVAIAALGLLNDSVAVVIGAMLVAPLMTPLIGAGLALAQGNFKLFHRSVKAVVLGGIGGLILSYLISIVVPGDYLSIQVIMRGIPNFLDLFIALFSGMAAAYAFSRVSVAEALVGVAIAAALVPPLASIGIMLGSREFKLAGGATVLLLTNLAAIVLGAAMVFSILKVRGARVSIKPVLWTKRVTLGLIVLVLLLIGPLGHHTIDQLRTGQIRPNTYPVTSVLAKAIEKRIAEEPNVTKISIGRSGTKKAKVGILLSSKGPVSKKLIQDLDYIVHDIRGREIEVRIWVVEEAKVKQ